MQLTHTKVLAKAWPVILASASTPLLGLVDTAVVGHTGHLQSLGGLALATLIFNFIFWAFGFLRMSTTGFIAQHLGAEQWLALHQTLLRALALGFGLGICLITLQWPLKNLAMHFLQASHEVEHAASTYFEIRIWGAPATLGLYVLSGLLIGLGKTRSLLLMQLSLNGLNALLNIVLGVGLEMGLEGIALGTVMGEWTILGAAFLVLLKARARSAHQFTTQQLRNNLWRPDTIKGLLSHNRDLFIRTLFLLASFAWFTNSSAQYGDTVLAANHILLQFIAFSAFFLDGFAFVAEGAIGYAMGAKSKLQFKSAVVLTTFWAGIIALLLSLGIYLFGSALAQTLTEHTNVLTTLQPLLVWACIYIAVSFLAFQLDGIFIGATESAAMRNASVISSLGFIGLYYMLKPYGVEGLWWSFIGYVFLRALTLMIYWPKLSDRFKSL